MATSSSHTSLSSFNSQSEEKLSFYKSSRANVEGFLEDFRFQVATAFAMGVVSAMATAAFYSRYIKRLPTGEWVVPSVLAKRTWIKGVVTSVGDADNFRLYHTPGPFWRWPLRLRRVPINSKDLKDETIHIRMAGVDAPEASHFGKPAQPYAPEALSWLKNEIEGKRIWVQMIRRDQYGRIVSIPILPPRFPFLRPPASRCVSISMLRAGFAITYEQSGAEYGRWGKKAFLQYEEKARAAKRGMWASTTALESPSEYKKRLKESKESRPIPATDPPGMARGEKMKPNLVQRIFRFWR